MTYQEFKNKYNGKYLDVDGYPSYWRYQCFDLAQAYIMEVLGLPSSILAGCKQVKNMLVRPKIDVLLQYFNEVPITAMCPGDVCIWSTNHIAIFDHWDGHQNWYFSQNPNRCQVMVINQAGLHAFRKKTAPKPSTTRYVNLPAYIDTWRFYKPNVTPVKANASGTLKPKKYGGLSYVIRGYKDSNNCVLINTKNFGQVKIFIKNTPATITNSPQYNVVG